MSLQPHMVCFGGDRGLIWNFAISDLIIAGSYVLISASLFFLIRARSFPFRSFFAGFAAFIFCCALTHAIHVVALFSASVFWLEAVVNDITAAVSFVVAGFVIGSIPDINSFLRSRSHDRSMRSEGTKDTQMLTMLSSELASQTALRAEGMRQRAYRHDTNL